MAYAITHSAVFDFQAVGDGVVEPEAGLEALGEEGKAARDEQHGPVRHGERDAAGLRSDAWQPPGACKVCNVAAHVPAGC